MIIGLLYGSFAVVFICVVLNAGKYTLQPGQSVELKVFSKTEQLEYNSELHFKKLDDAKLKLSGRKGWGMKDSNIVYNVEKQTITELIFLKDKTERKDLPNDSGSRGDKGSIWGDGRNSLHDHHHQCRRQTGTL